MIKSSLTKGKIKGHMNQSDRLIIEKSLNEGKNFKEIAEMLGKNKTTISREIKAHHIEVSKGIGRGKFNDCARRSNCKRRKLCGTKCTYPTRYCYSCAAMCSAGACPEYIQYVCPKLSKPPYVCNGCKEDHNRCTLTRTYYRAVEAHKEYRNILSESRQGAAITEETAAKHAELIRPLLEKNQSVYNILLSCPEIEYSEKTVYNYIEQGVYPGIGNYSLPRKIRYRPRKKAKPAPVRVDRKCMIGRKWEDFQLYREENPDIPLIEMDCVEGLRTEPKTLLTLHFVNLKFQFIFVLERKTSENVVNIFKWLRLILGEAFRVIFRLILTDNGSEFTNPFEIECSDYGEITTRVFYCHPYSFTQKGSCEKNHEEIRYILPKGTSIQHVTQQDANLIMSHINSLARASLGGRTPYERFAQTYGYEVLQKIGIKSIPSKDVNLTPNLIR